MEFQKGTEVMIGLYFNVGLFLGLVVLVMKFIPTFARMELTTSDVVCTVLFWPFMVPILFNTWKEMDKKDASL